MLGGRIQEWQADGRKAGSVLLALGLGLIGGGLRLSRP